MAYSSMHERSVQIAVKEHHAMQHANIELHLKQLRTQTADFKDSSMVVAQQAALVAFLNRDSQAYKKSLDAIELLRHDEQRRQLKASFDNVRTNLFDTLTRSQARVEEFSAKLLNINNKVSKNVFTTYRRHKSTIQQLKGTWTRYIVIHKRIDRICCQLI